VDLNDNCDRSKNSLADAKAVILDNDDDKTPFSRNLDIKQSGRE
jgi:hypothetical protein